MKTALFSAKATVWFAATLFSSSAVCGSLYTFTTIDGPSPGEHGGEMTFVQGISDTHIIVGYAHPDSTCTNSFIVENGVGTELKMPRPEGWKFDPCMRAEGVNNSGHVVGTYGDRGAQANGFLYHDGVFSNVGTPRIPPMRPPFTMPQGISNSGLIVGNYQDSAWGEHAFVDISGYTIYFDVPGASATYAHGINDIGQVAGTYEDALGELHGYVNYWGVFRRLNYPGGRETRANGINDFGTVVGSYRDSLGEHGFVYKAGTYAPFDVPVGSYTVLTGINNRGQIVGSYDFPIAHKPRHGFVADPVTLVEVANGSIQLNAGLVKVTIPSTPRFDAVANIDTSSLTFGRAGNEASLMACRVLPGVFGSGNLRCTFSVAATGIACGDARVHLNGRLLNGTSIRGSDEVRVRGCP